MLNLKIHPLLLKPFQFGNRIKEKTIWTHADLSPHPPSHVVTLDMLRYSLPTGVFVMMFNKGQ